MVCAHLLIKLNQEMMVYDKNLHLLEHLTHNLYLMPETQERMIYVLLLALAQATMLSTVVLENREVMPYIHYLNLVSLASDQQ